MTDLERYTIGLAEARKKLEALEGQRRRAMEQLLDAREDDREKIRKSLRMLADDVELYQAEVAEWERRYNLAYVDALRESVAEAEAEYAKARAACRKGREEMAEVNHELQGWWNRRKGMDLSHEYHGKLRMRQGKIMAQNVEASQVEAKAYAGLIAAEARLRQAENELVAIPA